MHRFDGDASPQSRCYQVTLVSDRVKENVMQLDRISGLRLVDVLDDILRVGLCAVEDDVDAGIDRSVDAGVEAAAVAVGRIQRRRRAILAAADD